MNFLLDVCTNSDFLTIVQLILKVVDLIFLIVPIILIIMISIDFAKNVIANSDDNMKKNLSIIIKRIIYSIAIFLVPIIVKFSISLLGNLGLEYADCITNATPEKITHFKEVEEQKRQEQQKLEQDNINNSTNNNPANNSNNNTGNNSNNNTNNNTGNNSNSNTIDNTGKNTNVDFSKVYYCSNGKIIGSSNGIKLRECSSDYQTNFFQNIAITDNYIYFSYKSTREKNNETINRNKVVRVSKKTGKYQTMYIDYAGHAQSFDVANNYSFNSSDQKEDKIFLNYFTKYIKGKIPPEVNVGVTYSTFKGTANTEGIKKIPEIGIAVKISNNKPSSLVNVKQSKYMKNGKFDSDSYKKRVKQIGNNVGNTYFTNIQYAVDETHNQILLFDPRGGHQMGYIYKLNDFLNGKLTLIKSVHIDMGYGQGVEIYGDYIYYIRNYKIVEFRKYNIKTGKLLKNIKIDLTNYGKNAGKSIKELEGITVYKGKVYVALNYGKSGKNYALIAYLDGA